MVERHDRESVATFVSADPLVAGTLSLGEEAAHHARVRRLEIHARIALVDGVGGRAMGRIVRIAKRDLLVEAGAVSHAPAAPAVHLIVPIADKDRMLWLAEKSAEIAATSWRPVLWRRSRSVTPRGEGMTFHGKVRARMASALAQSGGAWMPILYPDATVTTVIAATPEGTRLLLDAGGAPLLREKVTGPVTIAVGPEGGIEEDEREQLVAAGFRAVSLGTTVLRFETAGIAALAVVRSALASQTSDE